MYTIIIPYTFNKEDIEEFREKNFKLLLENLHKQKYQDFVITIAEQVKLNENSFLRYRDLITNNILLKYDGGFNKNWILNCALRESKTEQNIIIDADMDFDYRYLAKLNEFAKTHDFFCGYTRITSLVGRDNPLERTLTFHANMVAMGGSWYTTKDFFWNKLGGLNELYENYGAEDNDTYYRAKAILGEVPAMNYPVIHRYHHWAKASPRRMSILETTKKYPEIITERLKKVNLGNSEYPTLINIEDIRVPSNLT
jgi:hypothetical protein